MKRKLVKRHELDFGVDILYNGTGFQLYALQEDMEFLMSNKHKVIAPAGFRTDGRSSPGFTKGRFNTWGKAARAWILHDLLYVMDYGVDEFGWSRKKARKFADKEMYRLSMELNPKEPKKNWLSYIAVRMFGASVYDQTREVHKDIKLLNNP